MFYIANFIRTDSWHFNIPLKHHLQESIRNGHLPTWSKDIGTGIPTLAESQQGSLYPLNLILFGLLPLTLAWNLTLISCFMLSFWGMYRLCQESNSNSSACLFSASTYAFSGFFLVHLDQLNHLQAMSWLPWVFWAGSKLWRQPSIVHMSQFALVAGSQLLLGHFQFAFITWIGLLTYFGFQGLRKTSHRITSSLGLLLALGLSVGLSAGQVLPTLELITRSSNNQLQQADYIFEYPFGWADLVGFVDPFHKGSPQDGSYPLPEPGVSGIFWENTVYMGLIPMILLGIVLVPISKQRHSRTIKAWWFVGLFGLSLALGKATPIGELLLVPGFNSFRMPSRFLVLTILSICILAGHGLVKLEQLLKNRYQLKPLTVMFISLSLIGLTHLDLWLAFGKLFPTTPSSQALAPPEVVKFLPADARVLSHGSNYYAWIEDFASHGWGDPTVYLPHKNSLLPNSNLLWGVNGLQSYLGLIPARRELYEWIPTPTSLNLQAVSHIISSQPLDTANELVLISQIHTSPSTDSQYLYHNLASRPRYYYTSDYLLAQSLEEAEQLTRLQVSQPSPIPVIEAADNFPSLSASAAASIDLIHETDIRQEFEVNTDTDTLIILADSYDPYWQARLDGKLVPVFPAFVNQRAIFVPAGTSQLTLAYKPWIVYGGIGISAVTVIILMGLNRQTLRRQTQLRLLQFRPTV